MADQRQVVTVPDAGEGAGDAPPRLGHFVLGRHLGAGGMGLVFEARDELLDRPVALKLLKPGRGGDPDAQARLLREAQALARLSHPHVVTVFEIGLAGDELFVAMELVDGATLREWMAAPHSRREILALFIAAGRGLAAVHDLGLVHRDFKPSNVLIDRTGAPKVGDFGLVGLADDAPVPGTPSPPTIAVNADAPTMTAAGRVMGTPAYMAPEQRDGERCDARADQFSFATTLVEALTGRLPADGGVAALPSSLRPILGRALAADRQARYPAMAPVLADLARIHRGHARRWQLGGAALAITGAVAVTWQLGRGGAAAVAPDPCPSPDAQLASMWGPARRDAVRARLIAIDPAQGAARFAAIDPRIAPYVGAWRDRHVASCRATRIDAAQSDTAFDADRRCLARRADELEAGLTAATAAADPAALDAALAGLLQLTPIDRCDEPGERTADADAPADPAARAAADALAGRIRWIGVQVRADRLTALQPHADAAVAEARTLGHPPTLAAALAALARVQIATDSSRAAVTTLRELTQVAARAHQDRDEAYAWIELLGAVGFDQADPDEALALVPAASAAVLRAGDPTDLRVDLLLSEAILLATGPRVADALARLDDARRRLEAADAAGTGADLASRWIAVLRETANAQSVAGDQDASIAAFQQLLDRTRTLYGPDSVDEAIALHNLAESFRIAGRLDEALAAVQESARINQARGGESLRLASNLVSIATVQGEQGAWAAALATYDRALALYRARLAPDDVQLAAVLVGRASALEGVDRLDEAWAANTDVIALLERAGAVTLNLPIARYNRGELARRLGRCDDALADYAHAVDGFTAQHGATSSFLIYPLVGQGRCLVPTGRAAAAIDPLERALGLDAEGGDALQVVLARIWLGRALADSGRDRVRGRALARTARAELAAIAGDDRARRDELRDLDRWLAAR